MRLGYQLQFLHRVPRAKSWHWAEYTHSFMSKSKTVETVVHDLKRNEFIIKKLRDAGFALSNRQGSSVLCHHTPV
jgi:hypothetical protein